MKIRQELVWTRNDGRKSSLAVGRWTLRPVARATTCLVGQILLAPGVGAAGLISLLDGLGEVVTKMTGS